MSLIRLVLCLSLLLVGLLPSLAVKPGYNEEIRKAQEFLRKFQDSLDQDGVDTLRSLMRIHDFKIDIRPAQERLMRMLPSRQHIWLLEGDARKKIPELELRIQKGWAWIMAAALYCDIYPLPWDFFPKLRELSSKGNAYSVTRGIFALSALEWGSCDYDRNMFGSMRERLLVDLPQAMQFVAVGRGLWIDCLLALYLAEQEDWVTKDLTDALALSQEENGSWNNSYSGTAKALWIFMENRDPKIRQYLRRKRKKTA